MRTRVQGAREIQRKRFGNAMLNAHMGSKQLKSFCELSAGCLMLMKQAMNELGLSARAYDKVRRVGRTIADLEQVDEIQEHHLAEAIQYRLLDRRG
jgi:magnesium chelatase family protein